MSALIAVLSGGLLYSLSTNLGSLWPLAWIAPAPVLWYALGPARPLHVGLVAFTAFLAGEIGLVPVYSGIVPVPALVTAISVPAAAFAAVVLLSRRVAPALPPWAGVLVFPALWTAWEYLFALVSPNGTLLSIAYSQAPFLALIQVASVAGIAAITFLVSLFPSGLALALRTRPVRLGYVVIPVCAIAASLSFGIASLLGSRTGAPIRVGLAARDDNRAGFGTRDRAAAAAGAGTYAQAVESLAQGGAGLVVLPEACITLRPEWAWDVRTFLAETARMSRTQIVVGFDEYLQDGTHRNPADVISSAGAYIGQYVKQRHLPGQDYQAGTSILTLPGGMGVSICKDLDFPSIGRRYSRAGVGVLLVPAWDFGKDAQLHARMAWLRGVEGGFAVVRCAEQGLLSVTDSKGAAIAVAESRKGPEVLLAASVRPGSGKTIYARTGDVFPVLCVLLSAALAAFGWRRVTKRLEASSV
jgi:apolipoprotein N-acyltransferase